MSDEMVGKETRWRQLYTLGSAIHFIDNPEHFDVSAREGLRRDIWELRNYVLERCQATVRQGKEADGAPTGVE